MRDAIGRGLLAALGAAAMVAGVLGLLGIRQLESRGETVVVAIGALLGGALVVRVALKGGGRAA